VARSRLLTSTLVAMLAPVVTVGLTACSDEPRKPETVEPDEVYLAVIRWQLDRQDQGTSGSIPTSAEGDDDLPVVYVAASDGTKIDTNVQARVAHSTVDEAVLRFADSRDQALEMDDETEPVKDDGVLLSVAAIEPDAARQLDIEVVVYRSIDDQATWLLTVDASGDSATITASTLQPS
jgi:hypothetical protein